MANNKLSKGRPGGGMGSRVVKNVGVRTGKPAMVKTLATLRNTALPLATTSLIAGRPTTVVIRRGCDRRARM